MESNQIEEWKSLDFMKFSKYSISTFGNIRNEKTYKLRKPYKNSGYYKINLCGDNKIRQHFYIHCLVAKTFLIDKKRNDQTTVDHINRNRLDNSIFNLKWANPNEQNLNRKKTQQITKFNSIIQKDKNGIVLNKFRTGGDAMKHLNISAYSILNKILNNKPLRKKLDYTLEFEHEKDLENEIWKEVKLITSKKIYVSQFGRIKNGKKVFYGNPNCQGYKTITINYKYYQIHRLVGEAFCNGKSKEKNIVNHKDSNTSNNNFTNLEWCSSKENSIHSIKYGNRKKYCRKIAKYDANMNIIETFDSIINAAIKYNINKSTLYASVRRNTKCKGFYWKHI
jgi:hypothetical protein